MKKSQDEGIGCGTQLTLWGMLFCAPILALSFIDQELIQNASWGYAWLIGSVFLYFFLEAAFDRYFDRKELEKNQSRLRNVPPEQLTPSEFEEYVAGWIAGNWNMRCQIVGQTGDFGADVIATGGQTMMAVQCKRYRQATGVRAVQEVNSARLYYDCNCAAVFTTGHFTKQAVVLAAKTGVRLFYWSDYTFLELKKS